MLKGRGRGPFNCFGRSMDGLETPVATSLARASALSFGANPMWPRVQWIVRLTSLWGMVVQRENEVVVVGRPRHCAWVDRRLLAMSWAQSRRYWAGWGRWLRRALMVAWLSVPMTIRLVRMESSEMRRCSARMIPTISASYTVCLDAGPRWNWRWCSSVSLL